MPYGEEELLTITAVHSELVDANHFSKAEKMKRSLYKNNIDSIHSSQPYYTLSHTYFCNFRPHLCLSFIYRTPYKYQITNDFYGTRFRRREFHLDLVLP